MTLLGKIFIVLILIVSIMFMAFSVAVYTTHKNWRDMVMRPPTEATADKPLGLKYQLENVQKELEQAQQEAKDLKMQLKTEAVARQQVIAALESRRAALEKQLAAALVNVQSWEAKAEKAVEAESRNAAALARANAEVLELTKLLRIMENDRDEKWQQVVALTNQLHNLQDERRVLAERRRQLLDQVSRMKNVLTTFGLTEHTSTSGIPPSVDGVITGVRADFVEVSLGKDDGIEVGHEMEVFRDNRYIGRLQIQKVTADRAVARVLKEYKQDNMRIGDRVQTRTKRAVRVG